MAIIPGVSGYVQQGVWGPVLPLYTPEQQIYMFVLKNGGSVVNHLSRAQPHNHYKIALILPDGPIGFSTVNLVPEDKRNETINS